MFPAFFGGQHIADSLLNAWAVWHTAVIGVEVNFKNFILLPYHFLITPERFEISSRYIVFSFLLFMMTGLFNFRKESMQNKFILSYILYFAVVWFLLGHHTWRYLFHIFPFVCMLVISYWERMGSNLLKIVLGVILAVNVIPLFKSEVNNNLFAVFAMPSKMNPGRSSRTRFLERSLTQFFMYEYINTKLSPQVKILLFREVLGYYLEREYVQGDPFRNNIIYEDIKSPEMLYNEIDKYGITHILVNTNNFKNVSYMYSSHVFRLLEDFLRIYTKRIHEVNGVELYEMKAGIGIQQRGF
ncbi:MAG: hypothetical protein ABII23_03310 [bacterium]